MFNQSPIPNREVYEIADGMITMRFGNAFLFTPGAGQIYFKIVPTFNSKNNTLKYSNSKTSSEEEHSNLMEVEFGYGLINSGKITLKTEIGSQNIETPNAPDLKKSGLSDFKLNLTLIQNTSSSVGATASTLSSNTSTNSSTTTSSAQYFYGSDFSLSPTYQDLPENDGKGNTRTGNLFSGGHSLGPFVGYQKIFSKATLGIQTQYHIFGERTTLGKNYKKSTNGGNALAMTVFSEIINNKFLFGANAGLTLVQPTELEFEQQGLKSSSDMGSYQLFNMDAYVKIPANQKLELIPSAGITKLLNSSCGKSSLEDYNEFQAKLSARIAI
jgi:hypothetical protein